MTTGLYQCQFARFRPLSLQGNTDPYLPNRCGTFKVFILGYVGLCTFCNLSYVAVVADSIYRQNYFQKYLGLVCVCVCFHLVPKGSVFIMMWNFHSICRRAFTLVSFVSSQGSFGVSQAAHEKQEPDSEE